MGDYRTYSRTCVRHSCAARAPLVNPHNEDRQRRTIYVTDLVRS